jgi:hypothetical protein
VPARVPACSGSRGHRGVPSLSARHTAISLRPRVSPSLRGAARTGAIIQLLTVAKRGKSPVLESPAPTRRGTKAWPASKAAALLLGARITGAGTGGLPFGHMYVTSPEGMRPKDCTGLTQVVRTLLTAPGDQVTAESITAA